MARKLEALLFERDPATLDFEVNEDEYRREAEKITVRLPRASGVDDVLQVLREEFMSFDGEVLLLDWEMRRLAGAVWDLWQQVSADAR